MPRDRHQNGWVEEIGKKAKKWKGHFYVYIRQPDGSEKRIHKAPILGPKTELKKWEAEKKLRSIIDKETGGTAVKASNEYSFGWFWEHRFRPLKEPSWKSSSAPKMVWFIENYVVAPFKDVPLRDLTRFDIQKHLNTLAEKFSRSVVVNFRTYVKAILDEALEQDFLGKNPARKLEIPRTRKVSKRALSVDEIAELLKHMDGRDRLIVRMFLVLGLRPGELFALRREDRIARTSLRIDEAVSPLSGMVEPKTEASATCVWLPNTLVMELDFWMDAQRDQRPRAFIFPSRAGTPISANNWLKRTLKKAGEHTRNSLQNQGMEIDDAFLRNLTLQALRRTCATHMQHLGSVKDVQAHLRHARPNVTAEVYMQEIPASVRSAVELLDRKLSGQLNTNEH
jgi:integrase